VTLLVATSTQTTPADSASHTVTKPTGTADGDLLVVCGSVDGDGTGSTLTAPGGWASVHNGGAGGGPPGQAGFFRVWTRTASGEGASWAFGSSAVCNSQFTALRITGAAGATIVATTAGGTTTPGTTHTAPTATAVGAGDLLICGWQIIPQASASTYVAQGSMTQHGTAGSVSGTWLRHLIASELLVAGGATGTRTMTTSLTPAQFGDTTWSLILSPAAAPAAIVDTSLHAEAFIGSAWVDLAALGDVRSSDGVTIRRGLSAEGSSPEPSACSLFLDCTGGKYSPRNPTGPNYGLIGRNTPLRVSEDQATSYLSIDAATGNTPVGGCSVSTPDTGALDITGDLDLRFDAQLSTWNELTELVSKWVETGNQRSWTLWVTSSGKLILFWSADGTIVRSSTSALLPISTGRLAVRATLDVNNGAGGATATFYTSDSISGTWTQLGDPVVSTGTTSLFSSTADVVLLDATGSAGAASVIRGRVLAAQVRDGIAGTLVANPDFTAQDHAATSFVDSTGKTWTLNGAVTLQKRDYRWCGEIPAWPIRWDISGRNVYTPLEASGVMRRLSQGVSPLRSALFRAIVSANPIGYWPVEDGSDSTIVASGLDGSSPVTSDMYTVNTPTYATNSEFPGSAPLAEFNGASLNARIQNHVFSGVIQVRFLTKVPAGSTSGAVIARVYTRGNAFRWDLIYNSASNGSLQLRAFDVEGADIGGSGLLGFAVDGQLIRVSVNLQTSGANVNWTVTTLEVGATTGGQSSGTVNTVTIGAPSRITMNPNRNLTDTVVGHVSYESTASSIYDLRDELNGFVGETAGRRFQRLCREEGVDQVILGDADATEPMGIQRPLQLLDLLKECAFVDGGLLYEPRQFLGLGLRTRESLQSQPATLTVPYTSLSQLDPIDDDANVINDVTVTRPNGSSARVVLGSGALSVLPPPAGVGRYDSEIDCNVADDTLLANQAGWRLHVGTVDEPRFPSIRIGQNNPRIALSSTVLGQLAVLELGDRVDITGPPAWLPPETISQLAIGWQEYLGDRLRTLTLVCVPESPFRVTRYASTTAVAAAGQTGVGRYSSSGTTLVGSESTTDTSWAITTPIGPRWTTDAAQFPMDWMCEGEQIRVTAITGTTSLQTATVQRSINGVVKAHAAGAVITLFQPAIYG